MLARNTKIYHSCLIDFNLNLVHKCICRTPIFSIFHMTNQQFTSFRGKIFHSRMSKMTITYKLSPAQWQCFIFNAIKYNCLLISCRKARKQRSDIEQFLTISTSMFFPYISFLSAKRMRKRLFGTFLKRKSFG